MTQVLENDSSSNNNNNDDDNTKITIRKIRRDRFENTIKKFKARGFNIVTDFLLTKARKSQRTAIGFSFPLDYLNSFIEQNYKGYNIETILPLLREGQGQRKQRGKNNNSNNQ